MNAFFSVLGQRAFWMLAITALLGELGVPVPVVPTALFTGAHALHAWPDVAMLAGAMVAANLIGDLVWFAAGRRYGTDLLKVLCRFWLIPDEQAARAREVFEHWGSLALVAGRFVPGVLLIASSLAGATGMSAIKFVGLTFVGAALYAVVVLVTGFVMCDQIGAVLPALQRLGWPLFVVVAAIFGAWTAWLALRLWFRPM